jgi:hypothetical protein
MKEPRKINTAARHVASDLRTAFNKYCGGASSPRLQCGSNTRRSAADDQNIARRHGCRLITEQANNDNYKTPTMLY